MEDEVQPVPGYLNTAQAAKRLKVSESRVRQLCNRGEMPGVVKVLRDWLIPVASVEGFVKKPPGRPANKPEPRRHPAVAGGFAYTGGLAG